MLDGLVAGKANKIIAHDLGISPRTVEVYRANVMTKMQADSLSDLVRMVLLGRGSVLNTAADWQRLRWIKSPAAGRNG